MMPAGAQRYMNKARSLQTTRGLNDDQQVDKPRMRKEFGFMMTDADYAARTGAMSETGEKRAGAYSQLSEAQKNLDQWKGTTQQNADDVWAAEEEQFITLKHKQYEGEELKAFNDSLKYVDEDTRKNMLELYNKEYRLPKNVVDYLHEKSFNAMGTQAPKVPYRTDFMGGYDDEGNYVFDTKLLSEESAKETSEYYHPDAKYNYYLLDSDEFFGDTYDTVKKKYMTKIKENVKLSNAEMLIKEGAYQDEINQAKGSIAAQEQADQETLAMYKARYQDKINAARATVAGLSGGRRAKELT